MTLDKFSMQEIIEARQSLVNLNHPEITIGFIMANNNDVISLFIAETYSDEFTMAKVFQKSISGGGMLNFKDHFISTLTAEIESRELAESIPGMRRSPTNGGRL